MDSAFIQARIDAAKALLLQYEAAEAAFAANGAITTYRIDTGQTVVNVERATVSQEIDRLLNRIDTLSARLNGGSVIITPGW